MGLITHSLPRYTGPYSVSTHDLELPLSPSPSCSFSRALLKSTNQPALQLNTLLFTLFYPSTPNTRNGNRMPWIERPLSRTADGYARFVGKSHWFVRGIVWVFGRGMRLPVEMDLPLIEEGEKEGNGNGRRVVVFSHGLSGNRTTYSQYCGELASRGYIVAALEHRDGSGPITVVKLDGGEEKIVDYIKENDIYYPNPEDQVPFLSFRASQLLLRQEEIRQLLSTLSRINEGEGPALELLNRRSTKSSKFGFEGWKGRMNLEETVMAGHSFGGATTIQVLRNNSTFNPSFKSGIALDPWADPIPPASSPSSSSSSSSLSSSETPSALSALPSDSSETLNQPQDSPSPSAALNQDKEKLEIDVPFLTINSEAFTLWKPHFYLIRNIVTSVHHSTANWFFTILGSVHLSFSDLPLILPGYLSSKKQTTPPLISHSLIVETSLEFLSGREGELLGGSVREGDEEYVNPSRGEEGRGPLKRDEGEGYERMHVKGSFA